MRTMVFFSSLRSEHIEQIKMIAPDWEIIHSREMSDWLPHLPHAEIVAGWSSHTAEHCLTADAQLRWVHTWGAGVNGLPFEQLKAKGIVLTNSSGVHAYPISETIFSMMLAFTRLLHVYVRNQQERKWSTSARQLTEMHGKTVGILGVGAIGAETARLAKAFGMKVLGLRRSAQPHEHVDAMYAHERLNELLEQSDYVINTLPLTQETRYIIGREQFKMMKPSAFYINIGRGETTDTVAMIEALQAEHIAGAGLDVFEQEPLPEDSPLWGMDNVIIAPHSSGSTPYYNERVMELFLPNLQQYVDGVEPKINRVDLDNQY